VTLLLAALGGYFLGAIPFGIVITRMLGLGDLRQIGSGNIGATNVLRTGNKPAALATLVLDSGKGAVAVLIAAALFGPQAGAIAGLGAFIGHLFPVWLGFRGGKGVATFLGTLLAIGFWAGLAACATWLAVAAVFRISSLSALVATALAPVWILLLGPAYAVAPVALMGILVWWRHGANIARLRAGTEPRIGSGRKKG